MRTFATSAFGIVAGVTLGILVRSMDIPSGESSHLTQVDPDGIHRHVRSITNAAAEDYCVLNQAGVLASQNDAEEKVASTLSDPSGWNAVRSGLVDFVLYDLVQCVPSDSSYEDIEVRFLVMPSSTGPDECGGLISSCVIAVGDPVFNPVTGHDEYRSEDVLVHYLHLNEECGSATPPCWQHVLNHETGHVLGLADPPSYGVFCVGESVMHSISYGCNNDYLWPTIEDKVAVYNSLPGAGSGYVAGKSIF